MYRHIKTFVIFMFAFSILISGVVFAEDSFIYSEGYYATYEGEITLGYFMDYLWPIFVTENDVFYILGASEEELKKIREHKVKITGFVSELSYWYIEKQIWVEKYEVLEPRFKGGMPGALGVLRYTQDQLILVGDNQGIYKIVDESVSIRKDLLDEHVLVKGKITMLELF